MRLAFFLLVLVNLLFFVWAQGYFGEREGGREPQRLQDQLQPDKMIVALPPAPAPAAAAPAQACRRIEGLIAKDAERLQQTLQAAGLAASIQPAGPAPSYWVNIPALTNKAAADKKAGELKLFGVMDFHVMQADDGSFIISLGVFRDEAVAGEYLQALNKKGVKSARVDTQTKAPALVRLDVRGAAELLTGRLPELLAGTAGVTAADCP